MHFSCHLECMNRKKRARQQRLDQFLVPPKNNARRRNLPGFSTNLGASLKRCTKRQTTIPSLRGVVVLEDMWRYRRELLAQDTSMERLLEILEQLSAKLPPREVLASTGVARVLDKLRKKHTDAQVRETASAVHRNWKTHFRCDKIAIL